MFLWLNYQSLQPDKVLPKKSKCKGQPLVISRANLHQKQRHSHGDQQSKVAKLKHFQELMVNISVSVTWNDICLVTKTPLHHLRDSNAQTKVEQSSSPTLSLLGHKVCVIPRADPVPSDHEADEKRNVTEEWRLTDLEEPTPPDDKVTTSTQETNVNSLDGEETCSKEHLCVHFHSEHPSTLKVSWTCSRPIRKGGGSSLKTSLQLFDYPFTVQYYRA